MTAKLSNNAKSTLAAGITASATSMSVSSADGSKFPSVESSDSNWFPATLVKSDGSFEIVRVTDRVNDVMTIVRAQEGTTALAFSAGDKVECRATAAALEKLNGKVYKSTSDPDPNIGEDDDIWLTYEV